MTTFTTGGAPGDGSNAPQGYWTPTDPMAQYIPSQVGPLMMFISGYLSRPDGPDKPPLTLAVQHPLADTLLRALGWYAARCMHLYDIPPAYESRKEQ